MRIWVDGYEANVQQRLGSSQVAFELLKNLEKIDHKNEYTILLPSKPLDDLPKQRSNWKYKILNPKRLWTRIALPLALFKNKGKVDLFFSPTHYLPRFSPVKKVMIVFDLSFLHFPQNFKKKDLWQLKNWTKYSSSNADHIITISKSSKDDIVKNYHIKSSKITIAYPGFNNKLFRVIDDKKKIKPFLKKYNIEGEYIIYIGTIQPRKNLIRLIEAFVKIDNLKLVLVGKTTGAGREGWMYEDILKKPQQLGIEDKIVFTNFVPTLELPYLLNGATAFILPSLWEGFGIPVIEAMACGTPVIVSNVSSLPEVVDNAGLQVNPNSLDQIEQAIRTISTDKKLRIKLSRQGKEQVKKFSWDKMTKQVLKVFEEVGSE